MQPEAQWREHMEGVYKEALDFVKSTMKAGEWYLWDDYCIRTKGESLCPLANVSRCHNVEVLFPEYLGVTGLSEEAAQLIIRAADQTKIIRYAQHWCDYVREMMLWQAELAGGNTPWKKRKKGCDLGKR